MRNLFRSFLFRLRKDLTFRITLFVGLGLAVVMTLIYLAIDLIAKASDDSGTYQFMFATGQSLFIASLSPAQNFGIAIPVNLITFTVLEFTQGTIRNKIITGNSKSKIYFNLVLSGLVFTIALIGTYSLLCLALGSICGGFDINGSIMYSGNVIASLMGGATINGEFFLKLIILALLAYVLITVVTIFFATLFRSIGPSIPVVIILIMICYLGATIFGSITSITYDEQLPQYIINISQFMKIANPFYSLSVYGFDSETSKYIISNEYFWWEVGNNLVYSSLFLIGGWLIFRKRDVK